MVDHLYKYCACDRVDILERGLIRFTQPSAFNDPFESMPALDGFVDPTGFGFLKEEMVRQLEERPDLVQAELLSQLERHLAPFNEEQRKAFLAAIPWDQVPVLAIQSADALIAEYISMVNLGAQRMDPAEMRDRVEKSLGILSLSGRWDSLLMWAHYADHHRGFVLELDATHPFFDQRANSEDLIRHVSMVRYTQERPRVTLFNPDADPKAFFESMILAFFLTKGLEWKYEEEWRMISALDAAAQTEEYDGSLVHLFSLPLESVSRVILGARARAEDSDRIHKIASDLGIPVWQAALNRKQFALDVAVVPAAKTAPATTRGA